MSCRRRTASGCASWKTDRHGPLLAATFNSRRRALNTEELLRSAFGLPLVTLKIVAAIHWEALRLWLKGARLVPHQNAASNSGLAIGNSNDYTSPALPARGRKRSQVDRPWQAGVSRRSMDRPCPN